MVRDSGSRDAPLLLEERCTITVVRLAATWLTMARQTGDMNSIVMEIADAGKGRSQDITWVGFNPA